jgi:two-component system phosphate regulon sensor histidine kinase PhoR
MKHPPLFWQIFPLCLGVTVASLLLTAWLATSTGHDFYTEHLSQDLRARALLLETTITQFGQSETNAKNLQDFVRQTGRRAATRITVINAKGTVLADSNEDASLMDNHASRPEVTAALAGQNGQVLRYSHTLRESMLYVAIPLRLASQEPPGALRLSLAITPVEDMLKSLQLKVFGMGLAVLALAALLSLYLAKRISRPLEKMQQGAEALVQGRIDQLQKIQVENVSLEMASLVDSINSMAEQINRRMRIIIQQRNELETVFSGMEDAVLVLDAQQKIIRMNQAASQLFRISFDLAQGRDVAGSVRHAELLALIQASLESDCEQAQAMVLGQGEQSVTLHVHALPLRDDADQSMGVLVLLHDLTRLNRLESIRKDFVANVSHELKTPITAIKGAVETLLDGALDDGDHARNFLGMVARQAHRLDAIVEDLLMLSRIEEREKNEKIALVFQPLRPVLEQAVQTCAMQADHKNIALNIECDAVLSAAINQPLLEQAIINFLTNAISYSPSGAPVTLRCQKASNQEGQACVHVQVCDSGPGIAAEHLPRLFERFYRCDKSRSREQGGTGLGLAIVKHIAQVHQGRVMAESVLGTGSVFTLTLPIGQQGRGL